MVAGTGMGTGTRGRGEGLRRNIVVGACAGGAAFSFHGCNLRRELLRRENLNAGTASFRSR